ncbi:unnamed protein product, partial [Nippostrongylus brasiliensis]|uniref:Transcriptional regulator n=1 Tax=Nippostrongylus brasiliensis TaxID=27835 RepID=A0A0N4YZV3_NIPBR
MEAIEEWDEVDELEILEGLDADDIPPFDTHPITDNRILHAIQQWNVTQQVFNRTRLYVTEDQRISTLRSIRYGEYRTRQLNQLKATAKNRPLTYAETTIQRDLLTGIANIFDAYLEAEFGKLKFRTLEDVKNAPPAPYFLPKSLPNLLPQATTAKPSASTNKPTSKPPSASTPSPTTA